MKLATAFFILVPIIALLGAVRLYVRFARSELDRLRRWESWSDRFFDSIGPVVRHPDIPEETLDLISKLNKHVTNPYAAQSMFYVYERAGREDEVHSDVPE